MGLFGRLRWQLTISHLLAIAFTLVSMVAAAVLLAAGWWTAAHDGFVDSPAEDARIVATAVDRLVERGQTSDVSVVLRALVSGDLRLADQPPWAAEQGWWRERLDDISYAVVVGRDGRLLASSAPLEAELEASDRAAWEPLVERALADVRDLRELVVRRMGDHQNDLGAYPVIGEQGRPIAAVVVARQPAAPAPAGPTGDILRGLAIFSAASIVVLVAALLFALVSASIVGYLLSRRLVTRLERLGAAVETLAAGDLSRRVEPGPPDEIGHLSRRFNHMADRLAATVAEREEARRSTETALREQRELVVNVSHELRTPLSLIRGHVESLTMPGGASDATRRGEYLTVVEREIDHLSRLIEDLFALSTAEAGALPLRLGAVALGEVVEEVTSSMRPVAHRERRVTLITAVAPDLPSARADRHRVVQILGNLLRNALRHTPEGGLIAVRAEHRNDRVAVTVEDTGEGIPPERLPRVFERFYRGDDARDRASGGAGLGLAIVRELVEAMGGDVSVESTVGQGSRFSFRLPLADT